MGHKQFSDLRQILIYILKRVSKVKRLAGSFYFCNGTDDQTVPPAELESVLLSHPDIADAGVIAVDAVEEATELPRAYIVHAKGLETDAEREQFAKEVQRWIETQVAKHKFLRGGNVHCVGINCLLIRILLGVVVIDAIPKRCLSLKAILVMTLSHPHILARRGKSSVEN